MDIKNKKITELRISCPHLRIEFTNVGSCNVIKTRQKGWIKLEPLICNCEWSGNSIRVRHARDDKNGKSIGYGDWYCGEQVALTRPNNFASSEIEALRNYFGIEDKLDRILKHPELVINH